MMEWSQPVLASGALCKIPYGLVPCPYPRWQLFHSRFFGPSWRGGAELEARPPAYWCTRIRGCVSVSHVRAPSARAPAAAASGTRRTTVGGVSERSRRTASRTLRAKEGPADRRGILRRWGGKSMMAAAAAAAATTKAATGLKWETTPRSTGSSSLPVVTESLAATTAVPWLGVALRLLVALLLNAARADKEGEKEAGDGYLLGRLTEASSLSWSGRGGAWGKRRGRCLHSPSFFPRWFLFIAWPPLCWMVLCSCICGSSLTISVASRQHC